MLIGNFTSLMPCDYLNIGDSVSQIGDDTAGNVISIGISVNVQELVSML